MNFFYTNFFYTNFYVSKPRDGQKTLKGCHQASCLDIGFAQLYSSTVLRFWRDTSKNVDGFSIHWWKDTGNVLWMRHAVSGRPDPPWSVQLADGHIQTTAIVPSMLPLCVRSAESVYQVGEHQRKPKLIDGQLSKKRAKWEAEFPGE